MDEMKVATENMSIEDALEKFGSIIWNVKGRSMWPLIRDSVDYVVIERAGGEIKPYEVVLFVKDLYTCDDKEMKRKYVLHRFIKNDEDTCIILGDNCVTYEHVPADKIVGVMTELIKNGKAYNFDSAIYKAYMNLWVKPYKVRKEITRARFIAKAAGRRFIKGIKRIGK